ncbi:PAS domain S-box protein [Methanomethylovorans sp.]|uniref:PAS domain S-box protein n=1 Tax=Methanomethylovorans sp. TaxID=2758717 RepID=UPI00351C62DD
MDAEMIIALINNAALLLALGVAYDILFSNANINTRLKSIVFGMIIGLIGIALMLNPWELSFGLFFDTRSILLSITSLFFGFIPAVIGALIIGSYRLYLGGAGVVMGVSVIACSVIIGLLWRRYHNRLQKVLGRFDLYIFGILVHIFMLICALLLPWPFAFEVIKYISLPVMLIYPIGTVLLGSILNNQLSRKRTQDELKENEARLQNFIDNVPVGMFSISSEGKVIQTNTEMAHILGLSTPDQVISYMENKREQLYVDPKTSEEIATQIRKYGYVKHFEFEALHSDGGSIWLVMNAIKNWDLKGESFTIDGFVHDVTERKKAEIKIAEEAARRRILIEQSNDGIVTLDQNGKVYEVNQKFADMLGYSQEEVLQLHVWDWDIQWKREELLEIIKHVSELGYHFETRQRRKDGTFIEVEISANGAIFEEKKLTFCVCRNITERKQAEEMLLHAKLVAEDANKSKGEFLSTMSHELRTPLNSIIGFSDMLLSGTVGNLNEKQAKYINHISIGGKHLLDLINDILDLSKIEAGKMELHYESFLVSDAIEEVKVLISPLAIKKKIELDVKIGSELGSINADNIKFKQILYNLASNAIKFTPEKGYVGINVHLIDNMLEISVIDKGIGIATKDLYKLFQPFKQLNSYLTREHEGTGLGLVLVKRYVEMHGGNVWVESEVGKGSIFTFTIPYC